MTTGKRYGDNPPTPDPAHVNGSDPPHGTTPVTNLPLGLKGKRRLSAGPDLTGGKKSAAKKAVAKRSGGRKR